MAALPDRLRAPIVLCYLEGHSNSEAAKLLGCPKGTIDSRLAAARKKLHGRLLKRGVALSGALTLESLWQTEGHVRELYRVCFFERFKQCCNLPAPAVLPASRLNMSSNLLRE